MDTILDFHFLQAIVSLHCDSALRQVFSICSIAKHKDIHVLLSLRNKNLFCLVRRYYKMYISVDVFSVVHPQSSGYLYTFRRCVVEDRSCLAVG